jgi:hypothetical protein
MPEPVDSPEPVPFTAYIHDDPDLHEIEVGPNVILIRKFTPSNSSFSIEVAQTAHPECTNPVVVIFNKEGVLVAHIGLLGEPYADQLIQVIEKIVLELWDPLTSHVVFCVAVSEMCEYQRYFHERIEQLAEKQHLILHNTFYYANRGDHIAPDYTGAFTRSSIKVCYPPVQEPQRPTIKRLT